MKNRLLTKALGIVLSTTIVFTSMPVTTFASELEGITFEQEETVNDLEEEVLSENNIVSQNQIVKQSKPQEEQVDAARATSELKPIAMDDEEYASLLAGETITRSGVTCFDKNDETTKRNTTYMLSYDASTETLTIKGPEYNPFVVTSQLMKYNKDHFMNKVKKVKLENIYAIGVHTFWGFDNLETIEFSGNEKIIGSSAFIECPSLTEIIFPNSVETLYSSAFPTDITSLYIGDNVKTITEDSFSNIKTEKLTISVSDKNPNFSLIENCLTELATGKVCAVNSSNIGDEFKITDSRIKALYNIKKISPKTIDLSNSCIEIIDLCFYSNKNLTSIKFPKVNFSVFSSFNYCDNLSQIENMDFCTKAGTNFIDTNITSLDLSNVKSQFGLSNLKNLSEIKLCPELEECPSISNCPLLTKLDYSNTKMEYVFCNNAYTEEIILSEYTTELTDYAFRDTKIKEIDLKNVTTIGQYAFPTTIEKLDLSKVTAFKKNNKIITDPKEIYFNLSSLIELITPNVEMNLPQPADTYKFFWWVDEVNNVYKPYSIINKSVKLTPVERTQRLYIYDGNYIYNEYDYYLDKGVTLRTYTKNGYTFDGYYLDPEFTEEVTEVPPMKLITKLYMKWIPNTYSITYVLNGGTNHETNPKTFEYNAKVTLYEPTKEGYTFGGWYYDATLTSKVNDIFYKDYNIALYAKWVDEHNSITVKNAVDATCREEGYSGDIYCKECDVLINKGSTIEKLPHRIILKNLKDATCTEEGFSGDEYCEECYITINEGYTTEKIPHTLVIKNMAEATCSEEGYTGDTYCSVCEGEISKGETIEKLPHTPEIRDAKEPTCIEKGYTGDTYCSVCGAEISKGESIKTIPHTPEVRNIKTSTCSEKGYTGDTYCSGCNAFMKKGESVDTIPHTPEVRDAKEPTCKEEGYTGNTYCSVCNEFISSGVSVNTVPHKPETRNAKEPTCKEEGYTGDTYCSFCDLILGNGETKAKIEHLAQEELKNTKVATCKEEGYTGDVCCTYCDEILTKGTVIPTNTNHTWNEGTVIKEATTTEEGKTIYICTSCSKTKTETIAKKPSDKPADTDKPSDKEKETITSYGISETELDKLVTGWMNNEPGNIAINNVTYTVTKDADSSLKITKIATNSNNVEIPKSIIVKGKEYIITKIDSNAFKGNKNITSVTIGTNIKSIGTSAFEGCTKLATIKFNGKLQTIGKKAFYKCSALKSVKLPSTVTSIQSKAFGKCTSLKNVTLSKKLTTIGDSAFEGCKKITKIVIPTKVKTIGKKAFYGCSKMKKVTLKTTALKKVGSKAFKKCAKGIKITMPKSKNSKYKKLLKGKY